MVYFVIADEGKIYLSLMFQINVKSLMEEEEETLYSQLNEKSERVRSWYQDLYRQYISGNSEAILEATEYEKKMLASCKRWHINSHMRYWNDIIILLF